MSTLLNLRIHSVKCVDETGGWIAEKFGDDEIYLGGFSIDANAAAKKIDPFSVNSGFDDGEVQKYNPPRVFATFQLGAHLTKPANFSAGFLLIEKDAGGMLNAIKKLYDKLVAEIAKKKNEAAGHANGTGVAIAPIAVGLIWSYIKPVIYEYVKDKILGWFGDDLFPLQDVTTTIMNADHTWHGKKNSPVSMVEFSGHGGTYQLFYDWELR